ncbi:MAG: cysteine desulfurase [bacterium]|nr:cysteine desulfurase [bacterium]
MSVLEATAFDVDRVRSDFPILQQTVWGKPLAYLDNAATTQKPLPVIEALDRYYRTENANVHRGVHWLSQRATDAYEDARKKVQGLINAEHDCEIIYTRGTTESINLIAQTFGRQHLKAGDEVVLSEMEHHSNIVPWWQLCQDTGAILRVIPINDRGELCLDDYPSLLTEKTKLVSVVHISNALGTVNPVTEIIHHAQERGIPVHLDGAQAVPHIPVDVQALGCDFYTFSGHKMFGPTGIGILYGKAEHLESMPPYQGGGSMIKTVEFDNITFADLPNKFEAGTPHIAGAVGLGAAIDYLTAIDLSAAAVYEDSLMAYATDALNSIPGLQIIGTAEEKVGVISFVLEDIHPHDIGTILDQEGVAVRAGHHCAQPVMKHFQIPATTRASLTFYNTHTDIDALTAALHKAIEVFN